MRRANPSLTAALSVSLIAHGLGLSGLAWWYVEHASRPKTAALDKAQVWVQQMDRSMMQASPPTPVISKPTPSKPPPSQPKPKPKVFEKPDETRRDDSGEANGKGTANRSTPGDRPMQANAGLEQADLMKQAERFSENAFSPASAGDLSAFNTPVQKSPAVSSIVPDAVANAQAASASNVTPAPIQPPPVKLNGPGIAPKAPPAPSAPAGTPRPTANAPLAQQSTPKQHQREIVGHRATVSDTESIALSKTNGGVFRAGRLDARKGLKVKTTIPRYGLAAEADFNAIGDVPTLIGARVDGDGNVLDVDIIQSSGSTNIDEDRRLAVWNWTLEPQKDKDGHVTDDQWTIALE